MMRAYAFGNGMVALDALHRYKNRRKLMLQPTRELHAGMNEFQRINGYRVGTQWFAYLPHCMLGPFATKQQAWDAVDEEVRDFA